MNSGQRTARRLAVNTSRLTPDSVCNSCLARLSLSTTHQIRTAATAAVTASSSSPSTSTSETSNSAAPRQIYQLRASVVLSRPPILTRQLHPFEKAFFFYQRRLNERLALPFTRYFYYKKGTPADRDWKRKRELRGGAAVRDIGVYNAYGKDAWNDELLVGDTTSEPDMQVEALIRDVEGAGLEQEEGIRKDADADAAVPRPLPRTTEADEKGDLTRLDRKLDGTLYLVVKNKDGRWRFPEGAVEGREGLHDTAERVIVQAGGVNMNTWVVGNAPVGHFAYDYEKAVTNAESSASIVGGQVFFMKARIMAGQANLSKNVFGDTEFQWLSKSEIEKVVAPRYWSYIKNMLVDR